MGRHPTRGEQAHLPVDLQPRHFAVPADGDVAPGFLDRVRAGRGLPIIVVLVGMAEHGAGRAAIEFVRRYEALEFDVAVSLFPRLDPVDREGSAEGDEQRGGVGHAALAKELCHVPENRRRRHRVFVAAEPVDRVGQVHFGIGAALGGRHQSQLATGLDHPLALLAVADDVGLDQVGAVVIAIPGQQPTGVLERPEIPLGEDAGAGREHPGAQHLTDLGQVGVGKDVRSGLRIPNRRHPEREVRVRQPTLRLQ